MATSIIPSGAITRANFADYLERGLRKVYFETWLEQVRLFEQIYNIAPSVKRQETDSVGAGLGQFIIKTEGASAQLDAIAEAYKKQYIHNTYALRSILTMEVMEDELYGVAAAIGNSMARAACYTQEVTAMDTFNNLAATAYTANGTAYTLLSTTQFRADGGTYSNQLASGADLSEASLEALLVQWSTQMVDQRGRKLAIMPKVLMVGPSDRFIALRLLNSIQRAFTADNDPNTFKDLGLTLLVEPHMTDDGRWFLLAKKEETGLMWWNRRPITMQRETDGQATGNLVMMGSYRESHGISHPVGIAGSP